MSTQFISVSAGWNLMSVPLSPANGDKDTLFPSATSFTFIYQNGYVPVDTLQHGQGFWVKFDSSEVIQFTGNTVLGDTINLHAGWNLIGSLSTSVAVNSIHSLPDSLVSSYYFVYIPGAGYQPIDTLHPGFGYWVNARDSGSIVLSWKEVVLSDSTKNAETFSNLTNVSLDSNHVTLTFDNVDNIPTIEPGTILVSDSGGGFARRVIGSTVKGNQLTVETEMASYDEVVDIARVDTSFELVFPDISVLNKLLGKPILSSGVVGSKTYSISTSTPSIALSPNARLLTLRFPNFNLAVNNGSGQVSVSADTVTFSLEATIQSFDFEFYFGLETFRFVTQMATSIRFVNMQILLSGVIETTDSIPLIPHPIILGIIPTPIVGLVLTPEFNLFAGLSPSFSLNGGLETNGAVEMNGTMQTGFEYANGDFNPVWNPNVTGSVQSAFEPTGSIEGELQVFLKPTIDCRINGTLGVGIFVKPYAYDQISYPPLTAELGAGVSGGISASMRVFSYSLFNTQLTLADYKWAWLTLPEGGTSCEGTPTVTYAGKTYNTVQIGTQCWLKENLDVGTMVDSLQNQMNNSIIEKYCYNNDPANCTTYGGLYQWNEAMQYSTTAGAQGICPTGWHIPTKAEYETLRVAVNYDGNALKAVGQGTGGGAGTNTSGFSALLSGFRSFLGYFYNLGYYSDVWSSTEYSAAGAYGLHLYYNVSDVSFTGSSKGLGFSVRCLED